MLKYLIKIQNYPFFVLKLSGGHSSNEVANKRYICPRYPFVAPGGEIVTSGIRPFSITYSWFIWGRRRGGGFEYPKNFLDRQPHL